MRHQVRPEQREELSLKEVLLQHKRKQHLTRLYNQGKLPFHPYADNIHRCSVCGKGARWVEESTGTGDDGKTWRILAHYAPIELLDIDEQLLCRACFCAHYYRGHVGVLRSPGRANGSIPYSQRSYDGDNFHTGEW